MQTVFYFQNSPGSKVKKKATEGQRDSVVKC